MPFLSTPHLVMVSIRCHGNAVDSEVRYRAYSADPFRKRMRLALV